MAFASNIDTSLIGVHEHGFGQLGFCPLLKRGQPVTSFFVEVEDRACTERNMPLIPEVIPDSIIGISGYCDI